MKKKPAPDKRFTHRDLLRHSIWLLMLVLFLGSYLGPQVVHVIGAGEGGVLFRTLQGGTDMDRVFDEGLHLIWPWDTLTKYNLRRQAKRMKVDVLTSSGLHLAVEVVAQYEPDRVHLAELHATIGPEYVERILEPEISSTVRAVVGSYTPEDIYSTRRAVIEQEIYLNCLLAILDKHIKLEAVLLTNLTLPHDVNVAIEEKHMAEQLGLEYEWRIRREEREVERKTIEAEGLKEYQSIIASSLSKGFLDWQSLRSTADLLHSKQSEIVLFGTGDRGLPVIAGGN